MNTGDFEQKQSARDLASKASPATLTLLGFGIVAHRLLSNTPTTSQPTHETLSIFVSETFADVRNISGGYDVLYVRGRTTPGDGGEGFFAWVPDESLPDNDGTILRSTTSPSGSWRRIFEGAVNVRWFGANGNASAGNPAANAQAIQAAIDAAVTPLIGTFCCRRPEVFLPAGRYRCSSALHLKQGCRLLGESRLSTQIEWDENLTGPSGLIADGLTLVENLSLTPKP